MSEVKTFNKVNILDSMWTLAQTNKRHLTLDMIDKICEEYGLSQQRTIAVMEASINYSFYKRADGWVMAETN